MDELIDQYLALVERAFHDACQRNIDAIETFERAYPSIIDAAYQRGLKKRA